MSILLLLVHWGKFSLFVGNAASEMFMLVTRRYLRIGKGKNWWELKAIERFRKHGEDVTAEVFVEVSSTGDQYCPSSKAII